MKDDLRSPGVDVGGPACAQDLLKPMQTWQLSTGLGKGLGRSLSQSRPASLQPGERAVMGPDPCPGGGPSSLRLESLGTAACSVEGLSEQGGCWEVWGQRKTIAFTLLPLPPRSKNPLGSSLLTVSNWGCVLGPRLRSWHVKGAQ